MFGYKTLIKHPTASSEELNPKRLKLQDYFGGTEQTEPIDSLLQTKTSLFYLKNKSASYIKLSFPLNGRRGLAGNVIDDTVNTANFVDDAVGNLT